MTDNNLIGPKPDGPTYPTPWQAIENDVCDAKGYLVSQVNAESAALEKEDTQLAKAIVDAVNAYYGGTGPLQDTWVKACRDLDAKDARIVTLEGRAQVAEELVKKLQKEAGARNERWTIMVREVDKRDARIADLERKLKRAHDTMADLHRDKDDAEKRAEAAEERADHAYKRLLESHNRTDGLEKRAEFWMNRAQSDESQVEYWKKSYQEEHQRAEKAEAHVRELKNDLKDTCVCEEPEIPGSVHRTDAPCYVKDTFTAPDGRVFRAGQRVAYVGGWITTKDFGTVTDFVETTGAIAVRSDVIGTYCAHPGSLRRVWDGPEEPRDVPVGTVIRGADDLRLGRLPGGWSLYHSGTGNWSSPFEWDAWDHGEDILPYVEWLPGDDE